MASETKPNRFSQACAGLSAGHASKAGCQPSNSRLASEADTASDVERRDAVHAADEEAPSTPSAERSGSSVAAAISARPQMKTTPPSAGDGRSAGRRRRPEASPDGQAAARRAPRPATRRTRGPRSRPASAFEIAAEKKGIIPAIAVERRRRAADGVAATLQGWGWPAVPWRTGQVRRRRPTARSRPPPPHVQSPARSVAAPWQRTPRSCRG